MEPNKEMKAVIGGKRYCAGTSTERPKAAGERQEYKTLGEKFSLEPKYYLTDAEKDKFEDCVYAIDGIASCIEEDGKPHPLANALRILCTQCEDLLDKFKLKPGGAA